MYVRNNLYCTVIASEAKFNTRRVQSHPSTNIRLLRRYTPRNDTLAEVRALQ